MGTDKNIKLHIVTDIKVKMLSRVLATRSAALLQQVVRPCAVASTAPSKHFSFNNKYAWYKTAWPCWEMYKDLGGQSSSPVFIGGLATFILSKEYYVVTEETIGLFTICGVLYVLTKGLSEPVSKWLRKEDKALVVMLANERRGKVQQYQDELAVVQEEDELSSYIDDIFEANKGIAE